MLDGLSQEIAAFRQEGLKLDFSITQLALLGLFPFLAGYAALVAAKYTTGCTKIRHISTTELVAFFLLLLLSCQLSSVRK